MASSSTIFGVKITKIFELPPPSSHDGVMLINNTTKPRILLESLQGPGGAGVSGIHMNPQVLVLFRKEVVLKMLLPEFQPYQLRLVVYPIIYDGFYTYQVVGNGISEPSTVVNKCMFNFQPSTCMLQILPWASRHSLHPSQNLWRRRYHLFLGHETWPVMMLSCVWLLPLIYDSCKEIKRIWENQNWHRARK